MVKCSGSKAFIMWGGVLLDVRRLFTAWAYYVVCKRFSISDGQSQDSGDDGDEQSVESQ